MDSDETNVGYIFDTNVLSALLDATHPRHQEITRFVENVNPGMFHVSAISLAELTFGVYSVDQFLPGRYKHLRATVTVARTYPFLGVNKNTSDAYAELKTNLAVRYRPGIGRRERPRWLEDWPDHVSGQSLQVDENDLWLCAQAKERSLTLLTTDRKIQRIEDADPEARLQII